MTIKQFLKLLALLCWFVGIFTGAFAAWRSGGQVGAVNNGGTGIVVGFNLTCAGLFFWNLADYLV